MKGFLWCPHCGAPHALDAATCPKTGGALASGSRHRARSVPPETIVGTRYRIRSWIGEESVALLYDAEHLGLGRRVVLKHVRDDGVARDDRHAEALEMEREARASGKVEHPNVAHVLDFGRPADGEAFLVREPSSRTKLAAALRVAGVLSPDEAGDILAQLLSGLDAIDDAGMVHCDLGSHNVALAQRVGCRPIAMITGLGRASAPMSSVPVDVRAAVHYASPELLLGGAVDRRSDLFSCGVLLFEMLAGRRPFEAPTHAEVRAAILADEPPAALSKLRTRVPSAWVALLETALQKDPAKRFQHALELQAALPSQAVPSRRMQRLVADAEITERGLAATSIAELAPDSEVPPSRANYGGGSECDRYIGRAVAGRYEIESLLGSGSAGAVYRATHVGLRRPVAVKILHDHNRTSEQLVGRFKAEALAVSKLDHPNVTRILDCGEEADGTLYLVMEFVEGRTLEAELAARGRFSAERAVGLALQILAALSVAHDAGIIHRDVKPENIMLHAAHDEDGRSLEMAKVCDFGIAKLYDREVGASELTTQGLILGSPVYMAPEQIRAEASDERTDAYGAGVTLFEMLTGRLPYEAESMAELFAKKLHEPPIRPSTFLDDIDPLLEDIVLRALEPDPRRRHASVSELRSELAELLKEIQSPPSRNLIVSVFPDA
jgi:serine/threonine protein kinase